MKRALAALAAVAWSCADRPPPPVAAVPDRACVLEVAGEPVAFEMNGPCDLVRDHKGEPKTHRYGGVTVFVAVGELEQGCGNVSRAVLIQGAERKLSARIVRGRRCPASGLDEKEFWLFAH